MCRQEEEQQQQERRQRQAAAAEQRWEKLQEQQVLLEQLNPAQEQDQRTAPPRQFGKNGFCHFTISEPSPVRSSSTKSRALAVHVRQQLKEQGVKFAEPTMTATNQLHQRPKEALNKLVENEGLPALAYVILVDAVRMQDPPHPIPLCARQVRFNLSDEQIVTAQPPQNHELHEKCLRLLPGNSREVTVGGISSSHILPTGEYFFVDKSDWFNVFGKWSSEMSGDTLNVVQCRAGIEVWSGSVRVWVEQHWVYGRRYGKGASADNQWQIGDSLSREPTSYLLAALNFLLSRGKRCVQDKEKRARFEFHVNSLCWLVDPKYHMERGCSNVMFYDSNKERAINCFIISLKDQGATQYISKPERVAICACEGEGVQLRTSSEEPWEPTEAPLHGLKHEIEKVFNLLEDKSVDVVYTPSWEDLEKAQNTENTQTHHTDTPWWLMFTGHTDTRNEGGLPALTLNGKVKSSDEAAKALCTGPSPPQLVVLNGCNSLEHAKPMLQQGVQHVICWETCVPDGQAAIFGQALIHELTKQDQVNLMEALKNVPGLFHAWGCPASALCDEDDPDPKEAGLDGPCGSKGIKRRKSEDSEGTKKRKVDDCSNPGCDMIELDTEGNIVDDDIVVPTFRKQTEEGNNGSTDNDEAIAKALQELQETPVDHHTVAMRDDRAVGQVLPQLAQATMQATCRLPHAAHPCNMM